MAAFMNRHPDDRQVPREHRFGSTQPHVLSQGVLRRAGGSGPSIHSTSAVTDDAFSQFMRLQWKIALFQEADELAHLSGHPVEHRYFRRYIGLRRRQMSLSRRYELLRNALRDPSDRRAILRAMRESGIRLPADEDQLLQIARFHRDRLFHQMSRVESRLRPYQSLYERLLEERQILWQTRDADALFAAEGPALTSLRQTAFRWLRGDLSIGNLRQELSALEASWMGDASTYINQQRFAPYRRWRKQLYDRLMREVSDRPHRKELDKQVRKLQSLWRQAETYFARGASFDKLPVSLQREIDKTSRAIRSKRKRLLSGSPENVRVFMSPDLVHADPKALVFERAQRMHERFGPQGWDPRTEEAWKQRQAAIAEEARREQAARRYAGQPKRRKNWRDILLSRHARSRYERLELAVTQGSPVVFIPGRDLPSSARLAAQAESLVGQIIHRKGSQALWEPLLVTGVLRDRIGRGESKITGLLVTPFHLGMDQASLYAEMSLETLLQWTRHAVPEDAGQSFAHRSLQRAAEAQSRSESFREQVARDVARSVRERHVAFKNQERIWTTRISKALRNLGLADYFTTVGPEGQQTRVPYAMARVLASEIAGLDASVSRNLEDILQTTYLNLMEDLGTQPLVDPSTGEVAFAGKSGVLEKRIRSAFRKAVRSEGSADLISVHGRDRQLIDIARSLRQSLERVQGADVLSQEDFLDILHRAARDPDVAPHLRPLLEAPLSEQRRAWEAVFARRLEVETSSSLGHELRNLFEGMGEDDISDMDILTSKTLDRAGVRAPGGTPSSVEEAVLQRLGISDPADVLGDHHARRQEAMIKQVRMILGRELTDAEYYLIERHGVKGVAQVFSKNATTTIRIPVNETMLREFERMNLLPKVRIFADVQGRSVPLTLHPEQGLIAPATLARVYESATSPISIPISALEDYEQHRLHPLMGRSHPALAQGSLMLDPPVDPRRVAPLGTGVGAVIEAAQVLRRHGARVLSFDIETTGLPDHYEALGLSQHFYPTEMGMRGYRVQKTKSGIRFLGDPSATRILVRPGAEQEAFVRGLLDQSEEAFVQRMVSQLQPKGQQALDAVRQSAQEVYRQTIRSYAALSDPRFQDPKISWASSEVLDEARQAARRTLKMLASGVAPDDFSRIMDLEAAVGAFSAQASGAEAVIAANAARAEANWIHRFQAQAGREATLRTGHPTFVHVPRVKWFDPQAYFRMLFPEETRYSVEHMAEKLGVAFPKRFRHTTIARGGPTGWTADVEAAARIASRLASMQPKHWMSLLESQRIEPGQLLYRVTGGSRALMEVVDLRTDPKGFSTLTLRYADRISDQRQVISGENLADLEHQLRGRYVRIDPSHRAAMVEQYWTDRARRDLRRIFRDPSHPLFQMAATDLATVPDALAASPTLVHRPGQGLVRERRDPMTVLMEGLSQAPEEGARAYRDTIESWMRSREARLHRRFLRQVQGLLEGRGEQPPLISHQEASRLLSTYYQRIRETIGPLQRPVRGLWEASLPLEIRQGDRLLARDRVNLASPASILRQLEFISGQHGMDPLREALSRTGAVSPSQASTMGLEEMAQNLHRWAQDQMSQGKLLVEDITAHRAFRTGTVARVRQIQQELLSPYRRVMAAAPAAGDAASGSLGGLGVDDLIALLERDRIPAGMERQNLWRLRHEAFSQLMRLAQEAEESPAGRTARSFLGIGSPDPANIRLPIEVSGEFAPRLGDLTDDEMRSVRRTLWRRRHRIPYPLYESALQFFQQYDTVGSVDTPPAPAPSAPRATRTAARAAVSSSAAIAAQAAPSAARTVPLPAPSGSGSRAWMLAAGAAAALGFWALGNRSLQVPRTPAQERRIELPEEVFADTPQGPGLDIQVRALRTRTVDMTRVVHATTEAIHQQLGIPLEISLHQVDDTRKMGARWAQDVLMQALRSE